MSSYKAHMERFHNMKTSEEFTEQELKALSYFLEKHDEDELAIGFAMRWFNCTKMTIMILTMRHMKETGEWDRLAEEHKDEVV